MLDGFSVLLCDSSQPGERKNNAPPLLSPRVSSICECCEWVSGHRPENTDFKVAVRFKTERIQYREALPSRTLNKVSPRSLDMYTPSLDGKECS